MLETREDILVVFEEELKIIKKEKIDEVENYEPIDNTLDESTLHYIKCHYSWDKRWQLR